MHRGKSMLHSEERKHHIYILALIQTTLSFSAMKLGKFVYCDTTGEKLKTIAITAKRVKAAL